MIKVLALPLLILWLILPGCLFKVNKCHTYTTCFAGIVHREFDGERIIGYEAAEVDTILIVGFAPNGRFDTPLDTFTWTNMDILLGRPLDTGIRHYLPMVFSGGYTSSRLNDNAVILQSNGRVYHLTDIMAGGEGAETVEHWCDDDATCFRPVLSMKVDGVFVDLTNPDNELTLYK